VVPASAPRARVAVVSVLVATFVIAAACSSSSSDNSTSGTGQTSGTVPTAITVAEPTNPTDGGTLNFGLGAETSDGWDPTNSTWASSATIVSHAVFDRLTEYDENHDAQPFLAESVQPNADYTAWTVKVRSGIKFHDGSDLDAQAVKFNLDKQKTSTLTGAALSVMGDITVVDQYTVQVQMKAPWATFPAALTTQAGVVAAPSQLQAAQPAQHPIGTGPFVFDHWTPDSELTVTKNPDYWVKDSGGRQLPYLDGINFKVLADVQSRGAAFASGSVDAIETFDPSQIVEYQKKAEQGQYQMYSNQNREEAVQLVYLNTAKPPFDDPLARQIVAYGTDRDTISKTQYLGLFPPTTSLFPETSRFYAADTGYPEYDLQKATELHDEYKQKYGKPLSFTLNLPSTPEFKAIGELEKETASSYGVDINLNLVDQSTLIVNAALGDFEATGLISIGDANIDPVFFTGDTVKPIGQIALNFSRLDDPQLTQDFVDYRSTPDAAAQTAAWDRAQQRIAQNLNVIFVVRNGAAVIYTNSVFGFLDAVLPNGQPIELTTAPYTAWVFKT
jgi:peptide/nickel transport system substrate-binding protein